MARSENQSGSVSKRLQKELKAIVLSGNKEVSAMPDGDNLFSWSGTIVGPTGTVYEGCTYKLSLSFPPNYPFAAPTVCFTTPIFHPNVSTRGDICLDILKEEWSSVYSVQSVLVSIQSLLGEPNNDSPLNQAAAQMWQDQVAFREAVLRFNGEEA